MCINGEVIVIFYVYLNRSPSLQPGSSPWMSGLVPFLVMGLQICPLFLPQMLHFPSFIPTLFPFLTSGKSLIYDIIAIFRFLSLLADIFLEWDTAAE